MSNNDAVELAKELFRLVQDKMISYPRSQLSKKLHRKVSRAQLHDAGLVMKELFAIDFAYNPKFFIDPITGSTVKAGWFFDATGTRRIAQTKPQVETRLVNSVRHLLAAPAKMARSIRQEPLLGMLTAGSTVLVVGEFLPDMPLLNGQVAKIVKTMQPRQRLIITKSTRRLVAQVAQLRKAA